MAEQRYSGPMNKTVQSAITLPERRSNRPVTFAHRIEYAAVRGLFGLFRLIGLDASSAMAGKFCRYVGPLIKSVSKRGTKNLRATFPDWSDEKINNILRDVWENLGRTVGEFAHLEKFTQSPFKNRIIIYGEENIQPLLDADKRVIFISGHFANWELMPLALHQRGTDYSLVYRAANNPLVDELIINERAKVMSHKQIPKGVNGARAFIDTLKSGCSLAILADQKFTAGIRVPFIGRDAMTTPVPARLAIKFGIPIVPVRITREKNGEFSITIKKPMTPQLTGDLHADAAALTVRINQSLEEDVLANPGQWLWLHQRWKIRQPTEPKN